MASTLFQAPPAKPGSSSSTNPCLDLSHFYEQEMNDLLIDARLSSRNTSHSRHYQHQPTSFRTAPAVANTAQTSTAASTDYSSFAGTATNSSIARNIPRGAAPKPSTSSSFLNRHWDLQDYAAEARKRSADQHDGLGPIFDFSSPPSLTAFSLEPSPSSMLSSLEGHGGFEDHFMHHHNPYAADRQRSYSDHTHSLHHQRHHNVNNMRATSQQEQVWMDMEQVFQQAASSPEINHNKDKGKSVVGRQHQQSFVRENERETDEWEHAWRQQSPLSPSPTSSTLCHSSATAVPSQQPASTMMPSPSGADVFLDMATKLPSEWPMAPWAIRTEAALMENEAMHQTTTITTSSTLASPMTGSKPLVSCGFAIDKGIQNKKEEYNDDIFEGEMLQAWISTLEQEKREANLAAAADKEEKHKMAVDEEHTDPLALDMALRRLQRLVGQLTVSSAGSSAKAGSLNHHHHPHLVAAAAAVQQATAAAVAAAASPVAHCK